ncbi:helix-turn-helix domain-containing protein [Mycobacteroides abscessus]|uniref:helix-turn-helix domain-containing protein n=1 Tax=Mycobacteroides abscessus TaxID=36809 RepID=UPI0005167508|nr:helix-turn-helix transcriptional regulator [Mycobacteroides abscessus subsp. abscessus]MBN7520725.1 helix-turn-helix transcriptional regulator [Mycobacteroides abscessus subsp. abscessus]QSM01976.1 helix-turn-helix DNA binding domain protein [Mycobacterium phage prophiGD11-3]QSM04529.1 helix-turn-helix DNA binding domain protein [Mycobacterium phage prophiGD08-3]RIR00136.1 XRE family transcriptional regulator [Mycobacteroides abscessus]
MPPHQLPSRALSVVDASGVPRRDIATSLGISATTLNRRLSGESPFKADELVGLANILGVKPSELL